MIVKDKIQNSLVHELLLCSNIKNDTNEKIAIHIPSPFPKKTNIENKLKLNYNLSNIKSNSDISTNGDYDKIIIEQNRNVKDGIVKITNDSDNNSNYIVLHPSGSFECFKHNGDLILKSINDKIIIGNNVIISSHSVVTKDIPDNSIVGGIPAKILNINERAQLQY